MSNPRRLAIYTKRAKPGSFIFPSFTRTNINRILKKTMILAVFDSGGIYPPHAFRRGATQETIASGSTFSVILTTGTWDAPGYRYYLDAHLDEALNIARIIMEHANSDSSDEDKSPDIARIKRNFFGYHRMSQINKRIHRKTR